MLDGKVGLAALFDAVGLSKSNIAGFCGFPFSNTMNELASRLAMGLPDLPLATTLTRTRRVVARIVETGISEDVCAVNKELARKSEKRTASNLIEYVRVPASGVSTARGDKDYTTAWIDNYRHQTIFTSDPVRLLCLQIVTNPVCDPVHGHLK
jgi:hypothetical protein